MIEARGIVEKQPKRKSSNKMITVEIRFIALIAFTVITLYAIYDTQRTNTLSLQIKKVNKILLKNNRNKQEKVLSHQSKVQQNKTKTTLPPKGAHALSASNLEWLNRDDSKDFRDYGDGSCGINTDRMGFLWLIRKWAEIATKHNIRYYLDYGSLLGAWRDEEAIPYDADTDIRVHNDDLATLFDLPIRVRKMSWDSYDDHDVHLYFTKDWRLPYHMRRRFSCKGKQVDSYEGQCSFTDPTARLIYRQWHLDLFVYAEYYDTIKLIPDARPAFQRSDIMPLVRCDFMKLEVRCPRKPKVLLSAYYSSLKPSKVCFNKTWVSPEEYKKRKKSA